MVAFLRSQVFVTPYEDAAKRMSSSSAIVRNRLAKKLALLQRIDQLDRDAYEAKLTCLNKLSDLSFVYSDPEILEEMKRNNATAMELRDITLKDIEFKKNDIVKRIQAIDKELKRLEKQCYVRM
jgi:hypothetical protein